MLVLPESLRSQFLAEARATFPAECCGLLEGVRDGAVVKVTAAHPAANVAPDPLTGFLIEPQAQFRLLRGLRGSGKEIVGCYHSHPNGRPEPSARDRAGPHEDGFVWVIVAMGGREEIAAFQSPGFEPLPLSSAE